MDKHTTTRRRQFLKNIPAMVATAVFVPEMLAALPVYKNQEGNCFNFLFQGDSITDGNRTRNDDWNHIMGHGYQYIIASKLWYEQPAKGLHFFNRGISGNKVTDLAERWQKDTLDLKPDLLSILIGINDISAFINGDKKFTGEQYETGYRALLRQTKDTLPNIQFVICEPFILPVGHVKDKWSEYSVEIKKRQQAARRIATEFDAIFIGLQSAFDEALVKAPAEYWIWDGIHPMPAGHELMAREWIKQVTKKISFLKS